MTGRSLLLLRTAIVVNVAILMEKSLELFRNEFEEFAVHEEIGPDDWGSMSPTTKFHGEIFAVLKSKQLASRRVDNENVGSNSFSSGLLTADACVCEKANPDLGYQYQSSLLKVAVCPGNASPGVLAEFGVVQTVAVVGIASRIIRQVADSVQVAGHDSMDHELQFQLTDSTYQDFSRETLPTAKMGEKSYSLRVITPKDKRDVIDFLSRFFFIDEPLNIETGMNLDYLNGKRCPELEEYCTDSIPEGNSVVAVSPSGQVVGVCINGGIYRNDRKNRDECPNEKFKKVLILLAAAEKQTDIFNRYPVLERLLDVKIISVDSDWRGQGICKALLEYTRKVAKEHNFQMVKVDCTSHISALAVKRLGFERIQVLKYSDHLEEESNKPVFSPPPPHFAVQVYIWKIEDI